MGWGWLRADQKLQGGSLGEAAYDDLARRLAVCALCLITLVL